MAQDVRTTTIATLLRHCEDCGQTPVITDSTPIADLGLDSLALIELVYELEDEFAVTLDAEALPALARVGDLVRVINCSLHAAT